MDRLTLDASTLLVAARAVGLTVDADGDRLSVRGPRGAAELVRLLVERKADILAALEAEYAAELRRAPEAPVPSPSPWPPRSAELADWPIPWRRRWGELSNELEDRGVQFPESERRAFDLVKTEMTTEPLPPAEQASLF